MSRWQQNATFRHLSIRLVCRMCLRWPNREIVILTALHNSYLYTDTFIYFNISAHLNVFNYYCYLCLLVIRGEATRTIVDVALYKI